MERKRQAYDVRRELMVELMRGAVFGIPVPGLALPGDLPEDVRGA